MRHILVRAAVLASVLGGATLAFAFSTGPPASRTGAFAVAGRTAEPNCSVCHSGQVVNDPAGSIALLGVPAQYSPGQTYPLTVRLDYPWDPPPPDPVKWGFQLQAVLAATGDSAGVWDLSANTGPDTLRVVRGLSTSVWRHRRYVEQIAASTRTGQGGPVTWTMNWVAPPADSGTVYFFLAANAANGDGQSFLTALDHVYTLVDSARGGGGNVSVPRPGPIALRTVLDAPFPNPMDKCTDVSFTLARAGTVDLAVHDLNGRRVQTLLRGHREAGSYGTFWGGLRENGTRAPNGVYFVRLNAPGLDRPASRKITLAR
jgi:hypothetical protein